MGTPPYRENKFALISQLLCLVLWADIAYTRQQHTRQAYDCFGRHAQIARVFYCLQKAGSGMRPFNKPAITVAHQIALLKARGLSIHDAAVEP